MLRILSFSAISSDIVISLAIFFVASVLLVKTKTLTGEFSPRKSLAHSDAYD